MNKYNYMLLLSSISCSLILPTTNLCKKNHSEIIDCMIDDLQEMDNLMKRSCQHTADMIESLNETMNESLSNSTLLETKTRIEPRISLSIKEANQNELKVACKGISADTIKTNPVNKNLFSITTPNTDILIKIKNDMISIKAEQEEKQEIDKKDEGSSLHSYHCSTARLKQSIEHPVNLQATIVDYNKDQKTLTVTIPYAKQSNSDPIVK